MVSGRRSNKSDLYSWHDMCHEAGKIVRWEGIFVRQGKKLVGRFQDAPSSPATIYRVAPPYGKTTGRDGIAFC
jgi:hypothetical protein